MRILIADDDDVSRRLLERSLLAWGYEVSAAENGAQAWDILRAEGAPRLAILDWMMPEVDGIEVCRRARQSTDLASVYIILVTAREGVEHIVTALGAGADDFITKPYARDELRARVGVGVRILELQQRLADHVRELQAALAEVTHLRGILPICCYCKSVRKDDQYWQRVEDYISAHSDVDFSHGICPDCWSKVVQPQMEEMWGTSISYEEAGAEQEEVRSEK